MKKKAIFLDRDGTINVEKNYLYKISELEFEEGCLEGLKILKEMGYLLIVITNQSGIGRGYYTIEQMQELNEYMNKILKKNNSEIEKFYFCPHVIEDNCSCRKPSPELLYKARRDFNIDLTKSYMLGDKLSDVECGQNAGVRSFLLQTGHSKNNSNTNDKIFKNILEFAKFLKSKENLKS
jgi:D,D-heptose 1,7-bisphosphate phosphatase